MKFKEEPAQLKQEYETSAAKRKVLSDDELERVSGGSLHGTSDFPLDTEGHWFRFSLDKTHIYRVRKTYEIRVCSDGSFSSPAALLDMFQYDGSEAWYKGTVTEVACEGPKEYYEEIAAPTIIHE